MKLRVAAAGAILDVSYRLVSQTNPARPGDVIILFGTGGGLTNPTGADGQIVPSSPLPWLSAPATVKIGGVDCAVQYAGGAPGLVAGAVQVVFSSGNATSQSGATVWIE